jgi:catechol 2,3-dioxygenase
VLAVQETERRARSTYLRGYEELYRHSLKVTAASRAGLGMSRGMPEAHRPWSGEFAAIQTTGLGRGWIDGDVGHGRAYRFDTPEGHPWSCSGTSTTSPPGTGPRCPGGSSR